MKKYWDLIKAAAAEWSEDKAPRLGAALAYYSILSLAPLLIISIAVAGFVFGEEAARGQIVAQIDGLVGKQGAEAIQSMIANARKPESGLLATLFGVATLLLGAAGVFGQLQDALNTIWEVEPKPGRGIRGLIKDRFFSITMVVGTGFLLLVSLVLTALLAAMGQFLSGLLPGMEAVWMVVNFVISFGVITFLFAAIFKVVPDVEIAWRDVWVGAAVTALLFTIGKFALGYYLGQGTVGSAYGAAGSLVVLLIWVYYSAQILFFGAEFTQVYAKQYGRKIKPSPNAVPIAKQAREEQGMPRKEEVRHRARHH